MFHVPAHKSPSQPAGRFDFLDTLEELNLQAAYDQVQIATFKAAVNGADFESLPASREPAVLVLIETH